MANKRRTIQPTASSLQNDDIGPLSPEELEQLIEETATQKTLEKWQDLETQVADYDPTTGVLSQYAVRKTSISIEEMDEAVHQGIRESWERYERENGDNEWQFQPHECEKKGR